VDLINGPGLLDIRLFVSQSNDVDWGTVRAVGLCWRATHLSCQSFNWAAVLCVVLDSLHVI
jgi:hypothetical protein